MPRSNPLMMNRRDMLCRCANGFGALALSGLFGRTSQLTPSPLGRAKRVIFLYMDGGPSQVDTFDPKPRLAKENGQPIQMKYPPTQFNDVGGVLASPWEFKQHGQSGIPVSSLFPEVAKHVDKLCLIRSMVSKFPEHTSANYFLHTGFGVQGRPSMGSWLNYGLGSECEDLPGFVVLNGGLVPPGGLDNFNSGFLPATYQGTIFRTGKMPVANVNPIDAPDRQRMKLELMRKIDRQGLERRPVDALESAIANYELAFKMQAAVPDLMDLSGESDATKELYGLGDKFEPTRTYGSLCLLARRLAERGVRFIEITCPNTGHDRWDQHNSLKKGHETNAKAVDKPIAGLLQDLAARGLLEDTLVWWGGEFGRTPMAQGKNGRDHNPHGFTIWMAGGGVKPGYIHGATDDYGYFAVENKVTIYDLHATILHLLGVDHKKLTFRFSGRDMRLTDVHGEVVHDIIA